MAHPAVGYLHEMLKDDGNMGKTRQKLLDKVRGKWAALVTRRARGEIL